tara:strand:- start:1949 stop:2326 length:378 start_codon:yes stop_codon:yes gene_type:complete
MIGDLLEKLVKIAEIKMKRDLDGSWYNGVDTYIEGLKCELEEAKVELLNGKKCFLEDELGDVLWDFICILKHLENDNKIEFDNVFLRALKKYDERVTGINNGESWDEIKKSQLLTLQNEENQLNP